MDAATSTRVCTITVVSITDYRSGKKVYQTIALHPALLTALLTGDHKSEHKSTNEKKEAGRRGECPYRVSQRRWRPRTRFRALGREARR